MRFLLIQRSKVTADDAPTPNFVSAKTFASG